MRRPRLIIVCGVPGSGKSTFALHVSDRFGAVRFASETFGRGIKVPLREQPQGTLAKRQ